MSWFQYRYNLSRVYPGRYTTLFVTIFFVVISVILALINIPLSAYSVQQDFLSNPNDTNRGPSFLPSLVQRNPGAFIPHTFVIGDTFQTNFSLLGPYKIQAIYARQDTNGSAAPRALNGINNFVHNNYDLKTCDVLYITLDLDFSLGSAQPIVGASAFISCWFPVFYSFDVQFLGFNSYYYSSSITDLTDNLYVITTLGDVVSDLAMNIANTTSVRLPGSGFASGGATIPWNGSLQITSEQCCTTCDDPEWPSATLNNLEQYETNALNNATISTTTHPISTNYNYTNFIRLQSVDYLTSSSALPQAINNTLRAVYHAIRLDLGIIRPNQIYNSPTRYNASIADISPYTHSDRVGRSTIGTLDFSNAYYSVHVPDLLYLTPVFKLKPVTQAITAVFVSTFTMLSVVWKIFDLVATSVVVGRSKHATYCPCPVCGSGASDDSDETVGYVSVLDQEKPRAV